MLVSIKVEELQAGDRKRFRIKVGIIPQERDNHCVCSVVQAVLKGKGIDLSQKEIADQLTLGREGFLVQDERMKTFLSAKGLKYEFYWRDETPFNEPYSVLEEMRDHAGIIGVGSHAYLFRHLNGNEVHLIDPKNGKEVKKDYYDLLREMGNSEGCFGLIKKVA